MLILMLFRLLYIIFKSSLTFATHCIRKTHLYVVCINEKQVLRIINFVIKSKVPQNTYMWKKKLRKEKKVVPFTT